MRIVIADKAGTVGGVKGQRIIDAVRAVRICGHSLRAELHPIIRLQHDNFTI